MKDIYVFLTDGFEETEAVATVDVLRRAGLPVRTVSLMGGREVKGSHDVTVIADIMFAQADFDSARMLVLPGGTVRINEHTGLREQVSRFAAGGGKVAAICAAPIVLGTLGLLRGRRATCYPGFEKYLEGAELVAQPAVVDGQFITGRGPGFTFQFALTIVEELEGAAKAAEVAAGLLLDPDSWHEVCGGDTH